VENSKKYKNANFHNYGVGSENGFLKFYENDRSYMSSFLPKGITAWREITREIDIEIITLDSFCEKNKIDFIHILKSDSQGFDFEGAKKLMSKNKIGLIYFEFIFSRMYENLPAFDVIYKYLIENNFKLVSFYKSYYQYDLISWTDVLFINQKFYNQYKQ